MSKTGTVSLLAGAAVSFGAFATASAAEGQSYTSADEVRAIVADMMADVDTRSSLMANGGMGGYDDGFYISDSTGNFRLEVGGLIQFRYMANFTDRSNDPSDFDGGFQSGRTHLWFKGNVGSENIFYQVRAAFDRDGGEFGLVWAYLGYQFDNGLYLKFGQFRPGFLREQNVLPEYQLAADRSVVNEAFNQGDAQGIELGYMAEDWRLWGAFTDGFRSQNTDYDARKGGLAVPDPNNPGTFDPGTRNYLDAGGESDLAFTLRGELKLNGTWEQFQDFTAMPGEEFGFMIGAAFHVEYTEENRLGTVPDGLGGTVPVADNATYFSWTVDVSLEGDGWNLFAAVVGAHNNVSGLIEDPGAGTREDYDPNDYGFVVQGGIFIPDTDWEVFGRYDLILADDDFSANDTFSTVTAGVNWYWAGHAAKFTLDVQYFIDEDPNLIGRNTQIGYLGSDDGGEFGIRAQFQLLF